MIFGEQAVNRRDLAPDQRARTQDDKPGRRKEDLRAAVVIMGG